MSIRCKKNIIMSAWNNDSEVYAPLSKHYGLGLVTAFFDLLSKIKCIIFTAEHTCNFKKIIIRLRLLGCRTYKEHDFTMYWNALTYINKSVQSRKNVL